MEDFTFEQLSAMETDQLNVVESAKFNELEKAQKDKLQQVGKILWLQDAIEKAKS